MNIIVEKITDVNLLRQANSMTTGKESNMTLFQCYRAMHSNARTQLFWIRMYDIPLSVASHLVRHVHAQPFQRSKRPDRDPDAVDLGRKTPTDLGLLLNAEEIVNISRARLCHAASAETRDVWERVRVEVAKVDPDLFLHMMRPCVASGLCREPRPCGFMSSDAYRKQRDLYLSMFRRPEA